MSIMEASRLIRERRRSEYSGGHRPSHMERRRRPSELASAGWKYFTLTTQSRAFDVKCALNSENRFDGGKEGEAVNGLNPIALDAEVIENRVGKAIAWNRGDPLVAKVETC